MFKIKYNKNKNISISSSSFKVGTVKSPKFGRFFLFKIELKIGGMSDQNCNYSLITGKVVACIGKVDGSTLSLQATFFCGKVGGRP